MSIEWSLYSLASIAPGYSFDNPSSEWPITLRNLYTKLGQVAQHAEQLRWQTAQRGVIDEGLQTGILIELPLAEVANVVALIEYPTDSVPEIKLTLNAIQFLLTEINRKEQESETNYVNRLRTVPRIRVDTLLPILHRQFGKLAPERKPDKTAETRKKDMPDVANASSQRSGPFGVWKMSASERPSPFTLPELPYRFVGVEQPEQRSMSVKNLIDNLTSFAEFYETLTQDIERAQWFDKPREVGGRNANANHMIDCFRATIAIDRLREYTIAKYGAELTIGTARQFLGDLISKCSLSLTAAEALHLEDAMDKLDAITTESQQQGQQRTESSGGGDSGAPWPEYMSAGDLAKRLGLPNEGTRKKLERLALKYDCFIDNESPRRGEARRLYRVADVLPKLKENSKYD